MNVKGVLKYALPFLILKQYNYNTMGKEKNFGDKLGIAGFHKHPENINKKGRPEKIYTILKKTGYNATDVKAAFEELGFYSMADLIKLKDDESKPVITRIIANQFHLALIKDDYHKVKEIMEYVLGKPKQETDINVNPDSKIVFENVSKDVS